MTEYPMVRVKWLDSCSTDAWHKMDLDGYEPMQCETVGYLIQQTDLHVALAGTLSDEGQCCSVMVIPRAVVLTMTELSRSSLETTMPKVSSGGVQA